MPYPQAYRPSRKAAQKSSEKNSKKSKAWLSDGSVRDDKIDKSPPTSQPWWRSPYFKQERLKKWEKS